MEHLHDLTRLRKLSLSLLIGASAQLIILRLCLILLNEADLGLKNPARIRVLNLSCIAGDLDGRSELLDIHLAMTHHRHWIHNVDKIVLV